MTDAADIQITTYSKIGYQEIKPIETKWRIYASVN